MKSELKLPANIPIEIQVEIIKHLPIKSLILCTSLSKLFNSIIKSPLFITEHSVRYNQQHYLLARYDLNINHEFQLNHVSVIENDNFPQIKLPILNVPDTIDRIDVIVVSSSHGLLCLFKRSNNNIGGKCFLWNPSIRRCIVIPIPNASSFVVGFGVCRDSIDPKLVKIRRYGNIATSNSVNLDVEVYSVSSGVWRTIHSDKPRKSVSLNLSQVVINGIIYFLAKDDSRRTCNGYCQNMIITFDLKSEKFGELYFPDSLARSSGGLFLSKRMESLAIIDDYKKGNQQVCDVWIMKHGVPNSYDKLFTFKAPKDSCYQVLGFRKNGLPILSRLGPNIYSFEVYGPCSKEFTDLEVFGNGNSMIEVTVDSLAETLLLIDQPNTMLINEDTDDDDDEDDDIKDDDEDDDNDGTDDDDEDAGTVDGCVLS
ncbi:F-box/kelch-repeat protein At3g23880-like [Rutidosis leptorrhynchoides]|uniref:F-box/kelch-repeat protein At3g23880-like n=1 Tax=Rutidosis leptorrhynchoides TaxID=125765 RepID=UPI003A9A525D